MAFAFELGITYGWIKLLNIECQGLCQHCQIIRLFAVADLSYPDLDFGVLQDDVSDGQDRVAGSSVLEKSHQADQVVFGQRVTVLTVVQPQGH